jgi:hypothetical protein
MSEYSVYDPDGMSIEELLQRLYALQGQISSLISSKKEIEGKLEEHFTKITQNADEIILQANSITTLDGRVDSAESSITINANAITTKVSSTDYTGAALISMINQTANNIKILAENIDLIGAVTVLSDISGNLGTITAGTLNAVNINTDKDLSIGRKLIVKMQPGYSDAKIDFNGYGTITVGQGAGSGESNATLNFTTLVIPASTSFTGNVNFSQANITDWGNNHPTGVYVFG